MALRLLDVRFPFAVAAHRIDAQPDNLAVSLGEFRFDPGHVTQLRRADGSKVFRVRKQDRVTIADPFMEIDSALCCLG